MMVTKPFKALFQASKLVSSKRFQRLSLEGLGVALGQAMMVIGSLAGVRVLTEVLSPSDYGELALGITFATLINQTVLGPLGNGVTRFFASAKEKQQLNSYLHAVRKLLLSSTWIVFIICSIIVIILYFSGKGNWVAIVVLSFLYALLSGYDAILDGLQNAARQRYIVAIHQAGRTWLRFIIAAILINYLSPGSVAAMFGYSISVVFVLISQYYFFLKISSGKSNDKGGNYSLWQKSIYKYSWPFATWGVFTWAQLVSDRWALGLFLSTSDIGKYAAIYQIGFYPLLLGSTVINQLFGPILFQKVGDANDKKRIESVNKFGWTLTFIVLGVTILVFIISTIFYSLIFRIFVSVEYYSVAYLLPWTALAAGLFAAGQTITLNIASQLNTESMIFPKILTSIIGTVLNFIGAYLYGINGVVCSLLIFGLIYFLWMAAMVKRKSRASLIKNEKKLVVK